MREKSSEVLENKEGIITDPKEAREEMRKFWALKEELSDIKEKLEMQRKLRIRNLLNQGFDMQALIISQEKTDLREVEKFDFNKMVIASESEEKKEIVSGIAKNFNIEIIPLPKEEKTEEEIEHQILKQLIWEEKYKDKARGYKPGFYAIDIAEAKATEAHKHHKNVAIIASDIVVIERDRILEKPGDKKEALDILNSLSGKELKVHTGVVLLTQTGFGEKVLLKEGVIFNITLRDFSESEAREYLEQSRENYLNIAGALDYSKEETQKIIDSKKPISIEPLKLERGGEQSILISPEIITDFRDYFKGMPKEIIEELLAKQRVLAEF